MTGAPHDASVPGGEAAPKIDTTKTQSARIWNYWLGGKDNFAVDRAAGDMVEQLIPGIVDSAREDRAFLGRAVRYLAGEAGIRQFLDIGTGLPTLDNTHEVAQRVAPEARIVYVDNDPLVLVHARALLTNLTAEGAADYLDADLRDPDTILERAFFDGLELLEPGVVSCSRWRPETTGGGLPDEVAQFCGVARKH